MSAVVCSSFFTRMNDSNKVYTFYILLCFQLESGFCRDLYLFYPFLEGFMLPVKVLRRTRWVNTLYMLLVLLARGKYMKSEKRRVKLVQALLLVEVCEYLPGPCMYGLCTHVSTLFFLGLFSPTTTHLCKATCNIFIYVFVLIFFKPEIKCISMERNLRRSWFLMIHYTISVWQKIGMGLKVFVLKTPFGIWHNHIEERANSFDDKDQIMIKSFLESNCWIECGKSWEKPGLCPRLRCINVRIYEDKCWQILWNFPKCIWAIVSSKNKRVFSVFNCLRAILHNYICGKLGSSFKTVVVARTNI